MKSKGLATVMLLAVTACTTPATLYGQRSPDAGSVPSSGTIAQVFAPGVISDDNQQWRITFTPDRRTAYFAESPDFFPRSRKATIYVSHLVGGKWSEPVVAPFSGRYSDIDPFITHDGRRLYFSSIRPVDGVETTDIDLWVVERKGKGWSDPVHLGPEVNSPDDELYPSVSRDGTLYFASGPQRPLPGRHYDIFAAKRRRERFAPRVPLGTGVNTSPLPGDSLLQGAWEFNPEISADGKTLVFTSLRPGGYGWGDLYVSHLVDGAWSPAVNLGPEVNTAAEEYHPTLSRDGRHLYFVRRLPKPGDFYFIPTSVLPALKR